MHVALHLRNYLNPLPAEDKDVLELQSRSRLVSVNIYRPSEEPAVLILCANMQSIDLWCLSVMSPAGELTSFCFFFHFCQDFAKTTALKS